MYYRISDTYCLDWGVKFPPGQRIVHEVCHIFDVLRFFAGPIVGTVIAEVIRIATRKRRGQYTWIVAVACLVIATLLPMLPEITILLSGRVSRLANVGGGLISLLFIGIYLALAIGTLMARLRYGK